jgi:hypothetical protein
MHVYGIVANHIALSGAEILPSSDLTCYYTTRLWTPIMMLRKRLGSPGGTCPNLSLNNEASTSDLMDYQLPGEP